MMRKRGRRDDWNGAQRGSAAPASPLFNLDELHERRILSWSPEVDDELDVAEEEPPVAEPGREPAPAATTVAREPARAVAPPVPAKPAAPSATPGAPGGPRGRPRRQVHFHVDPDEEVLLLAAVEKFGSQQKGLIGALQALQDIELVRDEVERLAAECERQRKLLEQAESIFGR
jgi:uncharacterized small protein (DUF1192 family)